MARKKQLSTDIIEQSWLTKTPWLSLALFLCTYVTFGWSLADQSELWLLSLKEQTEGLNISIEGELSLFLIRLITFLVVITVSLSLSSPVTLMTFVVEEGSTSDFKALVYIFLWSIFGVFILCSFNFFTNILIIVSANILLRLDLQKLKLKIWQIFCLIIFSATVSFSSGLWLFDYLHPVK
jgi:hypothetical protein